MPRWNSTPAASTQGRSRRGHTITKKVASNASAAQVNRLRRTVWSNSHSGATNRCRSSMRSDRRDGGAVVPRVAACLRPGRQEVAERQLELQEAHGVRRPQQVGSAALAAVAARVHRPQQRARRQHHRDADLAQQEVARVEDGGVGPLQHDHAEHRDEGAEAGPEPDHRGQGRHEQQQAHDQPDVVAGEAREQVPRARRPSTARTSARPW